MPDGRDFFEYCHKCLFYDKCGGPEPPKEVAEWGGNFTEKPQGCRRFEPDPKLKVVTK
jgi:hypothetical protein